MNWIFCRWFLIDQEKNRWWSPCFLTFRRLRQKSHLIASFRRTPQIRHACEPGLPAFQSRASWTRPRRWARPCRLSFGQGSWLYLSVDTMMRSLMGFYSPMSSLTGRERLLDGSATLRRRQTSLATIALLITTVQARKKVKIKQKISMSSNSATQKMDLLLKL